MNDNRPVGLFDSGLGGLTVFEQVVNMLPRESVVYFGDTANVPYGGREVNELVELGDRIIRFLMGKGVKYVLFACNTSSSVSIGILRERYPVPMIGLVRPGARSAVAATRNKRIGILATEATVKSGSYPEAIASIDPAVQIFSQAAPLLVPLVEGGRVETPEAKKALGAYLAPFREAQIDTLVLGCTHYPFFAGPILQILGEKVAMVDPAVATTAEARREIMQRGMQGGESQPRYEFYTSGDPEEFNRLAGLLSTRRLPGAIKVEI
ncbi:MAG: glutamate racemase [Ammonifex sp.]|jgi:glutamate racemase|nr:MAG: glutamate racemase [Ammonifex sp.]